jgi:hypothetical protein
MELQHHKPNQIKQKLISDLVVLRAWAVISSETLLEMEILGL